MVDFDKDDIERDLPDVAKVVIAELMLAYARLDSALAACLVLETGMKLDVGAILIENLDIGSKISRLRRLYKHRGTGLDDSTLLRLKKEYEKRSARNTVAHATCGGVRRSDPYWVVFAPVRASIGLPDSMEVVLIHLDQMMSETKWAIGWADTIMARYDALAAGATP